MVKTEVRRADETELTLQNAVVVAILAAKYATVLKRIFIEEKTLPICINKEFSASFISKSLLPKTILPEKSKQPIAVRGVVGTNIINQYIAVLIAFKSTH